MDANKNQVGGTHYNTEYQHWDLVEAIEMPYLEGNATKYLSRWRKKNGVQDLEKAKHYIQKRLENMDTHAAYHADPDGLNRIEVANFLASNRTPVKEGWAILLIATWTEPRDLQRALELIDELIAAEPQDPKFKDEGDEWKRP